MKHIDDEITYERMKPRQHKHQLPSRHKFPLCSTTGKKSYSKKGALYTIASVERKGISTGQMRANPPLTSPYCRLKPPGAFLEAFSYLPRGTLF